VACVFTGSTTRIYYNGSNVTKSSAPTPATTWGATGTNGNEWYIGRRWDSSTNPFLSGYVSNFRFVNGTAVYTANFTPSTTPLTAISGTSLLTCADNRFIDDSTNNFAITRNGDVSVQRFSPFAPPAAYSTATIGGSGYFDGSGDFLTASTNAAFNFGTGDFTMECWAYGISTPDDSYLMAVQASGGVEILMTVNGGNFRLLTNASGSFVYTTFSAMPLNQWVHLAIVRESGVCYGYTNGVKSGTSVSLSNNLSTGFSPSINGSGAKYLGYLTDARMVKGTAVYTAAFTPPTAPLTAITNTSLLLSFTNAAIFDNAMMNDLETVGNAQISTSVVKFGTGSMYFDGTGDYLTAPSNINLALGTGDFTAECWVYLTTNASLQSIFNINQFNTGILVRYDNSSNGYALFLGGTQYNSSVTTVGQWVHLAAARASGTVRFFVNGTQTNSASNTYNITGATFVAGTAAHSLSETMTGYIDDLRITNGVARYTANFTPPTAAFPNF
jgi:hypothetical protein